MLKEFALEDTIKHLKEIGELKVIEDELDVNLEIPHIAYIEVKKETSKALLFTNPVDKKEGKKFHMPVLMNVFGSMNRVSIILGDMSEKSKDIDDFMKMNFATTSWKDKFSSFMKVTNLFNLFPKKLDKAEGVNAQEVVLQGEDINLFDLPILKTWEKDGGKFITMGQTYTVSEDRKKKNLGMYRLQILDKNKVAMHWQIHKDSSSFFNEYKAKNKKMPVSIAIGGDILYTWCATAPLPKGMYELMLYSFIRKRRVRLLKSITNEIYIPSDVDIVIEGYVDTNNLADEGPFGDHTGYYTPVEKYPVLEVEAITMKKKPTYVSTVVGKPPLEDKYFGYATERLFLPMLANTFHGLIDYHMPENGVFHNLILVKIKPDYPAHSKQIMHSLWGMGQISFVKHAFFVDNKAPSLESYDEIVKYMLNRFETSKIVITEGVCDALDHSSPEYAEGGKLGVDFTEESTLNKMDMESDSKLKEILKQYKNIKNIKTYYKDTKNPITVISVKKEQNVIKEYEAILKMKDYFRIVVFIEDYKNDIENPYMLVWRVFNNIDAKRDILFNKEVVLIDASDKNKKDDDFNRVWPEDTDCNKDVIDDLIKREILEIDEEFLKKHQIITSAK